MKRLKAKSQAVEPSASRSVTATACPVASAKYTHGLLSWPLMPPTEASTYRVRSIPVSVMTDTAPVDTLSTKLSDWRSAPLQGLGWVLLPPPVVVLLPPVALVPPSAALPSSTGRELQLSSS